MNALLTEQFDEIVEDMLAAVRRVHCSKSDTLEGLQYIQEQLEIACITAEEAIEEEDE